MHGSYNLWNCLAKGPMHELNNMVPNKNTFGPPYGTSPEVSNIDYYQSKLRFNIWPFICVMACSSKPLLVKQIICHWLLVCTFTFLGLLLKQHKIYRGRPNPSQCMFWDFPLYWICLQPFVINLFHGWDMKDSHVIIFSTMLVQKSSLQSILTGSESWDLG